MKLHSLVIYLEEAIFRNCISTSIIEFKKCSNDSKKNVGILIKEYNTQTYVKHVKIDEQLKRIDELINFLNSRILILEHKKYQNWIMSHLYVNKPKLLYDEIQRLCNDITHNINQCKQMIEEYKETPYVKYRARSI